MDNKSRNIFFFSGLATKKGGARGKGQARKKQDFKIFKTFFEAYF